ncbi:MAG: tail fiber domain-containing protein [Bacteroidia bacterium]|nr:tail fiber domain-containing protein [Bacteroidia bacterium]
MKKIFLTIIAIIIANYTFSQTPQSFQYQAVVRDASGTAMVSQPVNFQISIISGSISGTVVYVETHAAITNSLGIVILNIGEGTASSGIFANINWGSLYHFIKVEADPTGNTSYLDMGTTQLLSVPYALYAETAGNAGSTYTQGNGIDITGNVISNTSPDQTVVLNSGTGASVTGTYPNFTINNTQPDQTVNLSGAGSTSVSGAYPNFTISSTDNNTTYNAGSGINVTGTTITNTAPDQNVSLTQAGATTITGTYPNFTISSTDNNTTYTAGSGLSLTGTTFANTSPDQTVTMVNGTGITITGSYPTFTVTNSSPNATHTGEVTGAGALTIANNAVTTSKIADGSVTAVKLNSMSATNGQALKFNGTNWAPATDANTVYTAGAGINITGTTITNTAPNQTVTLTQAGATTITGTSPNFTISSTDLNTGTPGGLNKTIQFNNSGVFAGNSNFMWDNSNERLGVGLNNPSGRMVVQGSVTALATEPLFEVKNNAGQTVFVVYQDSVNVFVNDDAIQSNRGGFAVSGRNSAKAFTNNYLRVTPDNTRIHTGDTLTGFGVSDITGGPTASYMQMTPTNYFIGHQAGHSITSGKFNSFIGYQAGYSDTSGYKNYFIGYRSGYRNLSGYSNIFIGDSAGYNNTTGIKNVIIGNQSGLNNLIGKYNVFLGFKSGYTNNADYNVFLGYQAGYSNTTGWGNTANGYSALYSNTVGRNNVANGYEALYTNVNGDYNVANGYQALYFNNMGAYNSANGYQALYKNTNGNYNVASGYQAMYSNTLGQDNTAQGYQAMYFNTTAQQNVAIGKSALFNANTNYNVAIGNSSLYSNTTGSYNTALGFSSFWGGTAYVNSTALGYGTSINASNQVRVGNSSITSSWVQVDWTIGSDLRIKKNINENIPGLDFIKLLRPVSYNYDISKENEILGIIDSSNYKGKYDIEKIQFSGFIAQEVDEAANKIGYDFSGVDKTGPLWGLRYSQFTVPIVKAVQEQQAMINDLKTQNDMLRTQNIDMQKQINELRELVIKK